MDINEKENMLDMLNTEMWQLMSSFACATHSSDANSMMTYFHRMLILDYKIYTLKNYISLEKKGGYVTKFGDGVFSQDELEYWNGLYSRIEQYNIQQKTLALANDFNRKK